jgi:hypothetical protein
MTSQSRADEVARSLNGLTALERAIARNRLAKFFDGGLPQWGKQVKKTGVVSMGYVLVAYVWGTFAGVLGICGCVVVYVDHKSSGLPGLEIFFFAFSGLLIICGLIRWIQGLRVGRQYRDTRVK